MQSDDLNLYTNVILDDVNTFNDIAEKRLTKTNGPFFYQLINIAIGSLLAALSAKAPQEYASDELRMAYSYGCFKIGFGIALNENFQFM